MPIKIGPSKKADVGRGLYKSQWGCEFLEGSSILLHPDGLRTHSLPALLCEASPGAEVAGQCGLSALANPAGFSSNLLGGIGRVSNADIGVGGLGSAREGMVLYVLRLMVFD